MSPELFLLWPKRGWIKKIPKIHGFEWTHWTHYYEGPGLWRIQCPILSFLSESKSLIDFLFRVYNQFNFPFPEKACTKELTIQNETEMFLRAKNDNFAPFLNTFEIFDLLPNFKENSYAYQLSHFSIKIEGNDRLILNRNIKMTLSVENGNFSIFSQFKTPLKIIQYVSFQPSQTYSHVQQSWCSM